MKVLGLTGSVAMGKSTAASMLRRMRVPVHDSDAAVHRLLSRGGAGVRPVSAAFPGVERDGAIDRKSLGAAVFGDNAALACLEAILHPLVREETRAFLRCMRRRRAALVTLDIPLLFETGGEAMCDAVAVVSAPAYVQRQRVLRRPGMTEARLNAILRRQMPDVEKRRRANFIVPTGRGKAVTWRALAAIVREMRRPA